MGDFPNVLNLLVVRQGIALVDKYFIFNLGVDLEEKRWLKTRPVYWSNLNGSTNIVRRDIVFVNNKFVI